MGEASSIDDMGGGGPPDLTPGVLQIRHVVLIVQENHTFDNYFRRYFTARRTLPS